jgi:hypothetical protein
MLGGASALDGGTSTIASSLSTAIDLAQVSVAPSLRIAFLDPVATGSSISRVSLRIWLENAPVFAQEFDSVQAAFAFFDDGVVALGDPTIGLIGDLDLAIELDVDAASPGDGFFANFVVALVPEPGSWLLLGAAGAALGVRRRR